MKIAIISDSNTATFEYPMRKKRMFNQNIVLQKNNFCNNSTRICINYNS